jgi:3-phosphoshikimate 1-carboxyvinyltransferase
MNVRISKADKSVRGTIQLPPSKSIYNRVQIIRALCDTPFKIFPEPAANDSVLLENLLKDDSASLNAEDAGTTFRFLTAYLAQKPEEWLLTGSARMKERPIWILVDALRELGADIKYEGKEGFPPLRIKGKKLKGGKIKIKGNVSSQFISALLMIAPVIEGGIQLDLEGEVLSKPYIKMTLALMQEFGVNHEWKNSIIKVWKQVYVGKDFNVEPDWSSASYWYEIAALANEVAIELSSLERNSIQGDAIVTELMKTFGVETTYTAEGIRLHKIKSKLPESFSYSFKSNPDLAQTLAMTCAALKVKANLSGVQSLRIKETDRLNALKTELEKTAAEILIEGSQITINPNIQKTTSKISFETYKDHRMALSLAPLALKFEAVEIRNSDVIKKSYPGFFNDLEKVGFSIQHF